MADNPGSIHADIMRRIHGTSIFAGFVPTFAKDLQGWNSEHPSFEELSAACDPPS